MQTTFLEYTLLSIDLFKIIKVIYWAFITWTLFIVIFNSVDYFSLYMVETNHAILINVNLYDVQWYNQTNIFCKHNPIL